MTNDRPVWADSLTNALTGLAKQAPKTLLTVVNVFAPEPVDDSELGTFLSQANENDAALTQMRLALAAWDAAGEGVVTADASGLVLSPRTVERRQRVYELLGLTGWLCDILDSRAPVFQDHSTVISKKFEPWYVNGRALRTSVYWDDYVVFLRDTKGWNAEAINALDGTSTEVVERLSDPTRPEARQTKGLVVGYVQSGKTANFTGVIAKAIDAGYRMIIVMTGTIELLRAQTQHRLDMELVGRENILDGQDAKDPKVLKELDYQQDEEWIKDRFIRHGTALEQPGVAHIRRVTTHHSYYRRLPQGLTQLRFKRHDKTKPFNDPVNLYPSDAYVAVIKKNKSALTKLIQDLTPIHKDLDDLPILIIDDESDQASVDTTNPNRWGEPTAADRKRTTINGLISNLLGLCKRAQYVGYTATPFANVFVDPDDERDIFPSNFLLSLRWPPGYMGVADFHDVGKRWDDEERTFANSNAMAHVRSLHGDPLENVDKRDKELSEALDAFVLSAAVKKYREAVSNRIFKHHTMLVHESVRRADHQDTAKAVARLWTKAGYGTPESAVRLKALWNNDFLPVSNVLAKDEKIPGSFEELKKYIGEAIAEITRDTNPVIVVNSDKEINQKKLDFEGDKVWRILVGGTQLSRGFTVEGLTITYFRRRALQADTLMQAGRWFGFRPSYRDLVRLYIRRDENADLYEAFEALLLDEEAFREELRQYDGFDEDGMPLIEPWQIPPLVSQHLPWLRPTARNKMWNAVIDSKGVGGRMQDMYNHPGLGAIEEKDHNLTMVGLPLLRAATKAVELQFRADGKDGHFAARVGVVSADDLIKMLRNDDGMHWHPDYVDRFEPIYNFLAKATKTGRVTDWVVVWPQVSKVDPQYFGPLDANVRIITRSRRDSSGRTDFVGSDKKHRQAVERIAGRRDDDAPPDAVAEVFASESNTRGAILVYLSDDRAKDTSGNRNGKVDDEGNAVVLFSIASPAASTPTPKDMVVWTVRRLDQPGEAAVDVK